MNYSKYIPLDVINGPGTRVTLFVSGCSHMCKGCFNQSTWSPDSGFLFDDALEDQIIEDLKDNRIKKRGLTLSGGDPLHSANVKRLIQLVKRVKTECPDKDIWLYSGYKYEELNTQQQTLISYVDVMVDGKFEQSLHDPNLPFRGSANQRIIELTKAH